MISVVVSGRTLPDCIRVGGCDTYLGVICLFIKYESRLNMEV